MYTPQQAGICSPASDHWPSDTGPPKGITKGSPPCLCSRGTFCQLPLHACSNWVTTTQAPGFRLGVTSSGSLPGLSRPQVGLSGPLPCSANTCLPSMYHLNRNLLIHSTFISISCMSGTRWQPGSVPVLREVTVQRDGKTVSQSYKLVVFTK